MIRMILYLCLLGVLSLTPAIASPRESDSLPVQHFDLVKLGEGELSWLGLEIYRASLWVADVNFDGLSYDTPVILSIEYARDITQKQLLSATDKQWRRLGRVSAEQRGDWLERLADIWPSVTAGDVIYCVVAPGSDTGFYNQNGLLGVVNDENFGPEFLSIWLDPNTSFESLRAELFAASQTGTAM